MVGKKPAPRLETVATGLTVQGQLGYLVETLSHKRAGSKGPREITQLVQCLPHKHEDPSPVPHNPH